MELITLHNTHMTEFLFLSVKDMRRRDNLDFSNTKYISQEEHENINCKIKPEFGDVLLTKVGTTLA